MNKERGGLHAVGNVVPSCDRCNYEKGAKDWKHFLGEKWKDRGDAARADQEQAVFSNSWRNSYESGFDLDVVKRLAEEFYDEIGREFEKRLGKRIEEAEQEGWMTKRPPRP